MKLIKSCTKNCYLDDIKKQKRREGNCTEIQVNEFLIEFIIREKLEKKLMKT